MFRRNHTISKAFSFDSHNGSETNRNSESYLNRISLSYFLARKKSNASSVTPNPGPPLAPVAAPPRPPNLGGQDVPPTSYAKSDADSDVKSSEHKPYIFAQTSQPSQFTRRTTSKPLRISARLFSRQNPGRASVKTQNSGTTGISNLSERSKEYRSVQRVPAFPTVAISDSESDEASEDAFPTRPPNRMNPRDNTLEKKRVREKYLNTSAAKWNTKMGLPQPDPPVSMHPHSYMVNGFPSLAHDRTAHQGYNPEDDYFATGAEKTLPFYINKKSHRAKPSCCEQCLACQCCSCLCRKGATFKCCSKPFILLGGCAFLFIVIGIVLLVFFYINL